MFLRVNKCIVVKLTLYSYNCIILTLMSLHMYGQTRVFVSMTANVMRTAACLTPGTAVTTVCVTGIPSTAQTSRVAIHVRHFDLQYTTLFS